jgi:Ca-activated chloride channel family protein
MLQLTNPTSLFAALTVPLLVWWWFRQRRNALRHPDTSGFAQLPVGRARAARWGGALLRGAALLLLVVALAGPRWPDLRTRIDTEGIALMMIVDASGSMAERDFEWQRLPISRLDAVKKVFRLFVAGGASGETTADGTEAASFEGRPTDLIGLVTFGTRPETACPLTLSHSVLLRLLDKEEPRNIPGESETNLSDAITLSLYRLQSAGPRRKVLVLLSDGEHNVPLPGSTWTPRQAAQIAGSLKVPIYTIDAGGNPTPGRESGDREGGTEPPISPAVVREQAVRTLQEVAHISGGRYFTARDTAGLLAACRAIDRLERTDIQSFQYRRYHEAYPWFALAAFVLLCTALGLEMTVWRRLP